MSFINKRRVLSKPEADQVPKPAAEVQAITTSRGPMSAAEFRILANKVRSGLESAGAALVAIKEGQGWKAAGYSSWTECAEVEFGKSRATIYRMLAAEKEKAAAERKSVISNPKSQSETDQVGYETSEKRPSATRKREKRRSDLEADPRAGDGAGMPADLNGGSAPWEEAEPVPVAAISAAKQIGDAHSIPMAGPRSVQAEDELLMANILGFMKAIEWLGGRPIGHRLCASCNEDESVGHVKDCALQSLIVHLEVRLGLGG